MADPTFKELAYRGLASAIGSPVDITTMLMRPLGYKTPDQQIVGGSEWIGKKMEDYGLVGSARSPIQEFLTSMAIPSPSGMAKGISIAAPVIGGMIKKSGSSSDSIQHILKSMSKNVDDDAINSAFGASGYVYHTPMRPFENSQQTAIGVKAKPISERVFSTESPLTAEQLRQIEAIPVSNSSSLAFAKELADNGAFAFLNKDGKRFSVVTPSAKQNGLMQATQYDTKGAIGDSQHVSIEEAIQRMIDSGYTKILDESRVEKMLQNVMNK